LYAPVSFTRNEYPTTHFYSRLSRLEVHNAVGRIMLMENSCDTIGNRIRALRFPRLHTGPDGPLVLSRLFHQKKKCRCYFRRKNRSTCGIYHLPKSSASYSILLAEVHLYLLIDSTPLEFYTLLCNKKSKLEKNSISAYAR